MIGRLLFSAALAASTVSAVQARHHVYSADAGVSIAAIDKDSIRVTGPYREAWTSFYSKSNRTSTIISVKTLVQFDCTRRASREIQLVFYNSDGDSQIVTGDNDFKFVVPETRFEPVLDGVCSGIWKYEDWDLKDKNQLDRFATAFIMGTPD